MHECFAALVLDSDFRDDGEAGPEREVAILLIEVSESNANRDALDDFHVVAGGVLGREKAELGACGPADLLDLTGELAAAQGVDLDGDLLTGMHVLDLGLLEVGRAP